MRRDYVWLNDTFVSRCLGGVAWFGRGGGEFQSHSIVVRFFGGRI